MFLGEHETYFYDSIKQKHRVLFSNLVYGIEAGCYALYIASGESIDAVKAELSTFGLKRGNHQKLKIVTSHQWFTPDGDFNARRVLDQYRSLIDEAVDSGFAGLYVSSDAADTFDYLSKKGMVKEWMEYENSYGVMFKFPMEAICSYRTEQIVSNSQILFQLLKGHKDTISPKTEKRILNEQLIRNTVYQQLQKTQGKTMTNVLFDYLDSSTPLTIENFWDLLESILREEYFKMGKHIEQNILKKICARIESLK